jgi:hypothetical protein
MERNDIKELIGKKLKLILDDQRETIFTCEILSAGEDYIKILDKYSITHFVKLSMIKYIGERK